MHELCLPRCGEMQGSLLSGAFDDCVRADQRIARISSYNRKPMQTSMRKMADMVDRLLEANAAHAHSLASVPTGPARPTLGLAVVTCMDARINVNEALGLANGEAHVIRNAGGIVTDDVLRSLVVSQWALNTREVIVIQHTGCGMLRLDEGGLRARLAHESGEVLPFGLLGFDDLEASVRESVRRLKSCVFLHVRARVTGSRLTYKTGCSDR
jgi:carbonic anhydrase